MFCHCAFLAILSRETHPSRRPSHGSHAQTCLNWPRLLPSGQLAAQVLPTCTHACAPAQHTHSPPSTSWLDMQKLRTAFARSRARGSQTSLVALPGTFTPHMHVSLSRTLNDCTSLHKVYFSDLSLPQQWWIPANVNRPARMRKNKLRSLPL